MTPLVDIGVNLTHSSFDDDREQVIDRAIAAGVHPHDVKQCDQQTLDHLRDLTQQPEVVAIGECGLDFNRDYSPRPLQEQWFEAQLQLACDLNYPVFLHERDAHPRFMEILTPYRDRLPAAVVHCFTGNGDDLKAYLDLDLHIGITGWICDERRGYHLQELVQWIPLQRLMLETDAPYLTPRTLRPKPKNGRNEPAFLPQVLQTIATAIDKPAAEVAEATTRTARQFFKLDGQSDS